MDRLNRRLVVFDIIINISRTMEQAWTVRRRNEPTVGVWVQTKKYFLNFSRNQNNTEVMGQDKNRDKKQTIALGISTSRRSVRVNELPGSGNKHSGGEMQ
ncbi:hypothetical protein H920_06519 [Fukomys damarensis]|uniref:Uncharacterized protein n=1 Tax=Fukomys damarensis TaxID=885580 RepID=A0A091EA18_FUKDA|nr:hypothetical protein H920_06519 [Fukomys damarensis]